MRFNKDEDDDAKLDVVRNAKKLGITHEPIPFSYKSGKDGREEQWRKKGLMETMEPMVP